ncbi:MAG TPA: helix-turn-helix transcriptional regulator [Quisquiliibacterium sp.]|nr:helix-turn-helix transcriptional regulator [Quisquiliibacterium sp.]HQN11089.1 helix-turn-helix transcriptional regulator [Quisquiliibacterium sp.]HQP66248.1 helix-turn-helix transcriptional regulator [Quisquiliibacterium sp.]
MPPALSPAPAAPERGFGAHLRYWRLKRGLSQLELSGQCDSSQRHLSFLESGRAQPSRQMVMRLCAVLDLPPRERNALLVAAGFAPLYRMRALEHPDLDSVKRAIDLMLDKQEPYPAVVVDRLWNLTMQNRAAARLMAWLATPPGATSGTASGARSGTASGPPSGTTSDAMSGASSGATSDVTSGALPGASTRPRAPHAGPSDVGDPPPNLLAAMLDPRGLRPFIRDWPDVAADVLLWIHREVMAEGPGGAAAALLSRLERIDGAPADWRTRSVSNPAAPFLSLVLEKDGVTLSLFTTITTLGTPHDVTLNELRIESFFPADAETAAWFETAASLEPAR